MEQKWEELYRDHKREIIRALRARLLETMGMTAVCLVLAVVFALLDWSVPAGIFGFFTSLGVWNSIKASKGTLLGALLDLAMLAVIAGIAIARWSELVSGIGGNILLVAGGLYSLYLIAQLLSFIAFRRSTITIANLPEGPLPLLPDTSAFQYFVEHQMPAGIVLAPASLPAVVSAPSAAHRCWKCGRAWTRGASVCESCRSAQVLVVSTPALVR